MVKRLTLCAALALMLAGCTKLDLMGLIAPASAEADQRVHESLDINARHGERVVAVPTDGYRFYVCSDVHAGDFPRRYNEFLRRLRHDPQARFGLQLGDLSNQPGALVTAAGMMQFDPGRDSVDLPVMSIVGNHDLFFNQWGDFKNHFGSSTYCFTVVTPHYRDLFVMLDSGGGCHGKTQMDWLRGVLDRRDDYRHCVVCSHVNLFRTDMSQFVSGNLPLEETYALMDLMASKRVDLYLQGHDHHRKETLYGGVRYLTLDCLKDEADYVSYFVFDVSDGVAWTIHDDL